MRVGTFTISLLLSVPLNGFSAASSAPAAAPAPAPAPVRPIQPAPGPSAPVAPGGSSSAAGTPSAPGQLPPANQQIPRGFGGDLSGQVVPRFGATTNATLGPNGQPMATNGLGSQFASTNGFGFGSNQFGFGLGGQSGAFSNQLGAFGNGFQGSNQFGFHFSNQFGTNMVLQDEARTPQDRALVAQIRQELLPFIRQERLPIHLVTANGVVTLMGVVLSAEQAQQLVTLVQQTPGVTSVNNQLRVNPNFAGRSEFSRDHDSGDQAFSPADVEVLQHLRGRMHHRPGEGGASESVRITARNGVVTLNGFVPSAAEAQALVAAAQGTPGVVRVDNDLRVRGQTGLGNATSPSGVVTGAGSSSNGVPFSPPLNPFPNSVTPTNNLRR